MTLIRDQGDLEFIASRLYGGVDDVSLARARHGNAVMLTCRPFGEEAEPVVRPKYSLLVPAGSE